MRLLGTKGHDELAAARAAEIDQVIERLAQFGPVRQPPAPVDAAFEQILLGYAALRSRGFEKCTVLLGQAAYDKAKESGLLAWCAEQYPNVAFEPPSHVVRGCHARMAIIDEASAFPATIEKP